MINDLDRRGRMLAQIMFSELEKIATRFPLKNTDDLFKARQVVADVAKDVMAYKANPAYKNKLKELSDMTNDLIQQEQKLKSNADAALSRYAEAPTQFVASSDEPDIDEVRKLISEVNKNKTQPISNRLFGGFKGGANIPPPKTPPKTPELPKLDVGPGAKPGGMGEFAKKVGYGTMAAGGLYGGAKLYQAKKERDQMSQFGGGGMY